LGATPRQRGEMHARKPAPSLENLVRHGATATMLPLSPNGFMWPMCGTDCFVPVRVYPLRTCQAPFTSTRRSRRSLPRYCSDRWTTVPVRRPGGTPWWLLRRYATGCGDLLPSSRRLVAELRAGRGFSICGRAPHAGRRHGGRANATMPAVTALRSAAKTSKLLLATGCRCRCRPPHL
jgi:hypothetical protein